MSAPYSHADHARKILVDHFRGEPLYMRVQYVQARLNGVICCARIVDAWDTDDGMEMWKLDFHGPIRGRFSVPVRNVRQCQGVDGHCACAPIDPLMQERAAPRGPACGDTGGATALPDGNHGEYLPETAK